MAFNVSKPNEYVVVTGAFIEDIKLIKKGWVWPWQRSSRFDLTPINYAIELQAMTVEWLEFALPAVFTIGPKVDEASLIKYARLLAAENVDSKRVHDLVKGIIEGETRMIAAGMTMDEIFNGRRSFKEAIMKNVQVELDSFGLVIYNANVKSLQDTPGSEYFSYMRKKTHEGAVNKAKVDVAEARYKGDVGEKEKQGLTRQAVSKVEADTVIFENETKAQISKAQSELATKQAEYEREAEMARIQAKLSNQSRTAELQKVYEEKRQIAEVERLRGDIVSKSKANFEASQQVANSKLYEQQKVAEAELYKVQREAEAKMKVADAELYAKQKDASGILAKYQAESEGLRNILDTFNGDTQAMMQYLMMNNGLYSELAQQNAIAVQGMQPKISVWNTDGSKTTNPVADIFKTLPPMLSTIQEQTGIMPPQWLAQMSSQAVETTRK